MCCATVIQHARASNTSTTVTNTTSYQCIPAEVATKVKTIVFSQLVNYTYSCPTTTIVPPTECSSETCGEGQCCASRAVSFGTNTTQHVLSQYCTARNTSDLSWRINNATVSTQYIDYARLCSPMASNNGSFLSSVMAVFFTFLVATLY